MRKTPGTTNLPAPLLSGITLLFFAASAKQAIARVPSAELVEEDKYLFRACKFWSGLEGFLPFPPTSFFRLAFFAEPWGGTEQVFGGRLSD